MSKAFTKESDDESDEASPVRPALPPGVQNLITPEGAQRLQEQISSLIDQKRVTQARQSPEAASSQPEVRNIENRLRRLQQLLDSVVVSQPAKKDPERVAFGSTVRTRGSNGDEITYRVVGVNETDVERGHISWRSPLARALLSKRVGDQVRFTTPEGAENLVIIEVMA